MLHMPRTRLQHGDAWCDSDNAPTGPSAPCSKNTAHTLAYTWMSELDQDTAKASKCLSLSRL